MILQVEEQKHTLVVIFHAFGLQPTGMMYIRAITETLLPNSDVYIPKLPFDLLETRDLLESVNQQVKEINERWEKNRYGRIILIGHSLGAGLARKVYICAQGQTEDAPFEAILSEHQAGYPWADKIERIILLAAVNRGWSISPHLSMKSALVYTVAQIIENAAALIGFRKWVDRLAINQVKRGSTLVTNLRMQWLAMQKKLNATNKDVALVVQLLGSFDDLVMPDDDIDLITGHNFVYLDVPNTDHFSIIKMDESHEGKQRKEVFTHAITLDKQSLMEISEIPADSGAILAQQAKQVTDVVFVIHGIRDIGYWTHKLARRVKRLSKTFETETSSYGYFAMLPFILKRKRLQNVEWLMDKYVENKFLYPNAEFSFIGHSNGTYLLAKALEQYPYIKFKRVVFAGSVVKSDYQWAELLRSGRVKAVLNYVASSDWVVALLPKGMGKLFKADVGGAGYDGFSDPNLNFKYIKGAHSAALVEENWNNIANFIVNGEIPSAATLSTEIYHADRTSREKLLDKLSKFAPLLWIGTIYLLGFVGWGLSSVQLESYQQSILILGFYLFAIYFFLTKF